MKEEELDNLDEEEFEMLVNGLIHPGDLFTPPDFMGGMPAPFGGMPSTDAPAAPLGGMDGMIAAAYDEMEGEEL